jgi:hypothetical protein
VEKIASQGDRPAERAARPAVSARNEGWAMRQPVTSLSIQDRSFGRLGSWLRSRFRSISRPTHGLLCRGYKARVATPGDPVSISERQLLYRRANRRRHTIFVVYLRQGGSVRAVVEIGALDAFALKPREHWLTPGLP